MDGFLGEGGREGMKGEGTSGVNHELVHSAWAKSGADRVNDSLTGVDVGDQLSLALRLVSSLLEDDNTGLHHLVQITKSSGEERVRSKGKKKKKKKRKRK